MDHVSGMKDSVWLGCHFYSNWSIDSMQSDSEYQQAFCVEITKIQNRKKWFLKNWFSEALKAYSPFNESLNEVF